MASTKEYLDFILEELSLPEEVTYRPMMGEYILYFCGKVIGGIYDDRLLLKPTAAARALAPNAPMALPYEGGKEMLVVEDVEDGDMLLSLIRATYDALPAPKKK